MDPLALLREFMLKQELDSVTKVGDRVVFGDRYSFPASAKVGYKSQQGKGDFYTLDKVFAFATHLKMPFGEYLRWAVSTGVGGVSGLDRKVGWTEP